MAFKKREQVVESDSEEEGHRYESEEEQSVNSNKKLLQLAF